MFTGSKRPGILDYSKIDKRKEEALLRYLQ
jgi:hypothetical protein